MTHDEYARELQALAATVSALCAYKKLYALDKKEEIIFSDAMEKSYNSLIKAINNGNN